MPHQSRVCITTRLHASTEHSISSRSLSWCSVKVQNSIGFGSDCRLGISDKDMRPPLVSTAFASTARHHSQSSTTTPTRGVRIKKQAL